ncbi:hypothetical protein K4F52_009923 [Lecanicillium sp. MT-2017a]|nr:hypothetical protein K4F52_009923 [Lecanicillium sp. MT-2017a]
MRKLPSDAFLPSGGFDREMSTPMSHPYHNGHGHDHDHAPTSIRPPPPNTSPIAPASAQFNGPHAPFQPSIYPFQPIHDYNPNQPSQNPNALGLSPSAYPRSGAAPSFNSPHASSQRLFETTPSSIRRSSSLSPTSIAPARAPHLSMPREPHATGLPAASPSLGVATSLSRSVSADAAAPQQTSLHLVQRLAQQNSLIREAWEAERTYLEANRKRAEEVYQEERAIMEDLREDWVNEKADLQREMQALRERLHRLEGENAALRTLASPGSQQYSAMVSPRLAPATGQRDSSETAALPPGLEGAARRPHFANAGGSRTSPNGQPDALAATRLDPRTQPETSPSRDFLASPDKQIDASIPLIDVQQIDPTLDGIFVKANAVQKTTFSETSAKSTPGTSPPTGDDAAEQEGTNTNRRTSSKAQTMQALAAGEIRRRTMHAGHTPNHSLSLFPTMTTMDGSGATRQSEATTPTAAASAPPEPEQNVAHEESAGDETEGENLAEPDPSAENSDGDRDVHMQPQLEPVDDMPLKGPLMVKNIPAQDEIFWAQVNKKLEPISHGENALPTVMRGVKDEDVDDVKPEASPVLSAVAPGDVAGAHDEPDDVGGKKTVEADVPLKLRTTTNFGAPFGAM